MQILFLNKEDLFRDRIQYSPIRNFFPVRTARPPVLPSSRTHTRTRTHSRRTHGTLPTAPAPSPFFLFVHVVLTRGRAGLRRGRKRRRRGAAVLPQALCAPHTKGEQDARAQGRARARARRAAARAPPAAVLHAASLPPVRPTSHVSLYVPLPRSPSRNRRPIVK